MNLEFSSIQLLSHVRLFATPWTAARQASLSITNSQSLLKLMSIESVMPSNQLILCDPLLLMPSIFPRRNPSPIFLLFTYSFFSESVLCIRWPNFGASASASVLPMNIQDWFPLGLTGWISLPSKVLSRVSSNTTIHTHVYMCVNIRYLFFSFWLTSFCMTVSRSIHVSANGTTSFLSMTE